MNIKRSKEKFVEKATAKHNGKFTYEKTVYLGADTAVEITCSEHGSFWQRPSSHLTLKHGCYKCAATATAMHRTLKAATEFREKAVRVHGGAYDYSRVAYKSAHDKVEIICPQHSSFWVTPNSHLNGTECKECANDARRLSQEEFVNACKAVHGDKYDYSATVFTSSTSSVEIRCREHGPFTQLVSSHGAGSGCPKCAARGYQLTIPGYLYVLTHDNITKIGITNKAVDVRARAVSKSFGAKFSVNYFIKFTDGSIPNDIETSLLKELRATHEQPTQWFDGYTECFLDVDRSKLITRVSELCIEKLCTTEHREV